MSRDLKRRIRQQEILAELGVTALQGASFDQLMGDIARLMAEGMQAEFCKVLEHNTRKIGFLSAPELDGIRAPAKSISIRPLVSTAGSAVAIISASDEGRGPPA